MFYGLPMINSINLHNNSRRQVNLHPHFTNGIAKIKLLAQGHLIDEYLMAMESMNYITVICFPN